MLCACNAPSSPLEIVHTWSTYRIKIDSAKLIGCKLALGLTHLHLSYELGIYMSLGLSFREVLGDVLLQRDAEDSCEIKRSPAGSGLMFQVTATELAQVPH